MENNSPHDNTNIRVSTRINVYGNIVVVGSVSVASVGIIFLFIWLYTHWQDAVLLSTVLVYSFVGLFSITILGLVVALWIRFVIVPGTNAYVQRVQAQGLEHQNKLIHTQENCVVIVEATGLKVIPLFPQTLPQTVVESDNNVPDSTILELHNKGLSLRDIEKVLSSQGVKYHRIQKVTSEAKKGD